MHGKLKAVTGLCLFLAALAAHAGFKTEALTIGDINADLKPIQGTPLDAVGQENIRYAVTGNGAYDEFFRKTAVAYGGFAVATRMSEAIAVDLRELARDWALSKEASAELRKLVEGKDGRALPPEVIAAALKDKKARLGRMDAKDIEYLARAAQYLAVAGASLTGSMETAATLLPHVPQLFADAGKTFALWDYPNVAKEVAVSIKRLARLKDEALRLARNVAALTALVAELSARR